MIIIYIKSPINYTGGKYKLLSEIVPLFPTKIDNFIDLFGGGADVSININANKIIYNDRVEPLVGMLKWISENDFDTINNQVIEVVNKYGLSMTNTDGFTLLRSDYNNNLIDKNLSLFVLNCYCFNNTSRFNIKGEFNQAFGKNRSCYNPKIKKNLFLMCEAFNSKDIIFENKDFYSVDFDFLTGHDLAYCDPPYLLSDVWYNKGGGGWSINDDIRLFELLDKLNDRELDLHCLM